jgi:hypothetical protein
MGRASNVDDVTASRLNVRLVTLSIDPLIAQKTVTYLQFAVESSKSVVEFGSSVSGDGNLPVALAAVTLGLTSASTGLADNKAVKGVGFVASEVGSDVSLIAIVNMASRANDPLSPAAYGGALTAVMLQKGLLHCGHCNR